MKYFTIGQIHKLGLLKNWKGEPYGDKATISRIVNKLPFKTKITPWGLSKTISEAEVKKWNRVMAERDYGQMTIDALNRIK